jgi:hypothetical protein
VCRSRFWYRARASRFIIFLAEIDQKPNFPKIFCSKIQFPGQSNHPENGAQVVCGVGSTVRNSTVFFPPTVDLARASRTALSSAALAFDHPANGVPSSPGNASAPLARRAPSHDWPLACSGSNPRSSSRAGPLRGTTWAMPFLVRSRRSARRAHICRLRQDTCLNDNQACLVVGPTRCNFSIASRMPQRKNALAWMGFPRGAVIERYPSEMRGRSGKHFTQITAVLGLTS